MSDELLEKARRVMAGCRSGKMRFDYTLMSDEQRQFARDLRDLGLAKTNELVGPDAAPQQEMEAELQKVARQIESLVYFRLGPQRASVTDFVDLMRPLLQHRVRADYRDCLELASAIAASVECYDSDDLSEVIVPHLQPIIGELERLRGRVNDGEATPITRERAIAAGFERHVPETDHCFFHRGSGVELFIATAMFPQEYIRVGGIVPDIPFTMEALSKLCEALGVPLNETAGHNQGDTDDQ